MGINVVRCFQICQGSTSRWVFYYAAKGMGWHIQLQLYQLMSYVERIIIGVVLILSAYTLYSGAEERHQFHTAFSQLSQLVGKCLGCAKCIEAYRQFAVVLIFTGGAALLMDAGVTIAILAQLILTALNLTALRGGLEVAEMQTLLINVALLVFLLRNLCEGCQKKEQVKAKAEVKAADGKTESKSASAPKAEASSAASPSSAKPSVEDLVKSTKSNKKSKA